MTILVVLLLYWSISGLGPALCDLNDSAQASAFDGGGSGDPRADAAVAQLPASPLPSLIGAAMAALQRTVPSAQLQSAERRMVHRPPPVLFTLAGTATGLAFDARTGAAIASRDASPASYQQTSKSWHRGNIARNAGQWLALVAAVDLALLALSGSVLT